MTASIHKTSIRWFEKDRKTLVAMMTEAKRQGMDFQAYIKKAVENQVKTDLDDPNGNLDR